MPRPRRHGTAYGPSPSVATQPSRSGDLPPAYESDLEPDGDLTLLASMTLQGGGSRNTYGFDEGSAAREDTGIQGGNKARTRKGKNEISGGRYATSASGKKGPKARGQREPGRKPTTSTSNMSGLTERGRSHGVWDETESTTVDVKSTLTQPDISPVRDEGSGVADPPSSIASSVNDEERDGGEEGGTRGRMSLFVLPAGGSASNLTSAEVEDSSDGATEDETERS